MKRLPVVFSALCIMAMPTAGMAQGTVDIAFNGTSATVNVPDTVEGVVSIVSGAKVTIFSATTSQEYTYRLHGTSDNGSLTISGSYKLILQLDGLKLTNSSSGAAIDVQCGKNIDVVLTDGTVNTLCDAATGSQKAALYFKGHPEFKGGGTLNVTGRTAHAISAKEEMQLKSSLGIINILGAVKDGLHCGKDENSADHNYFEMKGGTVNVTNVAGDAIDTGDYGSIRILGGALSLNVGHGATGLKADSVITVSDGNVNISVTGRDSEAIRARYAVNMAGGKTNIVVSGDGSKGIKGKRLTAADAGSTVRDGGFATISGGTVDIQVNGGNLIDAALNDTTKCMAMSIDADLVQTSGDVCLTAMGPEARTHNVKGTETHSGGTFVLRQAPWQLNAADYRYDMTVYATVSRNGQALSNYDDVAVGAFIGDACVGIAQPIGNLLQLRVYSNSTTSQTVTFSLYSYNEEREYSLTPAESVIFQESATIGLPDSPLVLSYEVAAITGDVNNDGRVDIADVLSVINIIDADDYDKAADIDNNGKVNLNDVVDLINIIVK